MKLDMTQAISKGRIPANIPLSTISTAYMQTKNDSALNFFPKVPVQLSTSYYYKFDKASLLRDDVRPKPILGQVDPTVIGYETDTYACKPKQIILGLDEIVQSDLIRTGAPGMMNAMVSRSRTIAEKIYIHQNKMFAKNFFNENAWNITKKGGTSSDVTAGTADYIQFDDTASDPVKYFDELMTERQRVTGRRPNKLGLGINVYNALKEHPAIKERVIYGGSTPNPAIVNENALAQILSIEKLTVFDAIWNSADLGADEDMQFICDENSALLVYATDTPAIDVATAGYTFVWDMGIGQELPIITWEGPEPTFSQYIGGMMSFDMKKVCDDLGVFLKNAVSGK